MISFAICFWCRHRKVCSAWICQGAGRASRRCRTTSHRSCTPPTCQVSPLLQWPPGTVWHLQSSFEAGVTCRGQSVKLFWDHHLDAECDAHPTSLAVNSKLQFERAIAFAGARQHQQNGTALRHLAPRPAYGSSSSSSHGGNSGPADANAGPRIFLGKLNKDTNEQDVKVRQPCASTPPCPGKPTQITALHFCVLLRLLPVEVLISRL